MGMTIDKAIYCIQENLDCTYGKYDEDLDAFEMAIDIMRKYQKIEQIYSDYLKYMNPDNLADRIGEVLEDGNDD